MNRGLLLAAALVAGGPVAAGQADVLQVELHPTGDGRYDIDVTVRHNDTGWDHFANRWEVLAPDGHVLATRVLYHPHVNEQPFTRSLAGVAIPGEYTWVRVRAHDLVHGYGGREVTLSVPRP
ncbi:MAG: hypothetical protein H6959_06385 [Chromatiaceae bacterium]|nr:hypothetical protein [Gammaproteobacteria bacterium]MCP5300455.1 hypothetical protein [Chromatiaceae bacterium]MCP5422527.1 hypothetical protein [Chromatiaceae bacterium]